MSATVQRRQRRRIEWTDLDPIGVGAELRKAREMLGIPPEEVAAETRIRLSYLLALEDEDFSRLPTGVAGRGLLRSYATYLGLDAVELLSALEAHGRLCLGTAVVKRGTRRPAPNRSALPRLVGILVAALCILGLAYFVYSQYAAFVAAEASGAPRATVSVRDASPTPLPPTATVTPITVAPVQQAGVVAALAAVVPSPTSAPRSPTPTVGPPLLVPSPTPVPPLPTPVELVVEMTASVECRVSSQVDGKANSDEEIYAGDQRTWRGTTITVQVADAGAVEVAVNGRPSGKLGPSGQAKTVTWTR